MYVFVNQRCYNRRIVNPASVASPVRARARRRPVVERLPNKHQEKTEETRRVLLKSARLIFARDGFQACRIEDIAAASGHTRGAFYAHFETKEELFFALLQEEVHKRTADIRAIVEGCRTLAARIAALRNYYVKCLADREWGMLVLEFKLFAVRHPKLRPKLAAVHRRIRESMNLDFISKLPGIDRIDNEPRRAILEGVRAGIFLECTYDPERLSERQATAFLGDIFDFFVSAENTR